MKGLYMEGANRLLFGRMFQGQGLGVGGLVSGIV